MSAEHSGSRAHSGVVTVAVIGGGIAGLIAAREVAKDKRVRPVIYEADERLGGKILTDHIGDVAIETGPDSFLARDDSFVALCRELGLEDELVKPAVFGARVWTKARLEALPDPSVYGMPATPSAAMACTALSARARVRAAAERALPSTTIEEDVSVGDFVRARFGSEVLERLVDPLLAGTRAGDVDRMSLAAALPQVKDMVDSHGSVMRAFDDIEQGGTPEFIGLRSGMSAIVDALRRNTQRVEVRLGSRVDAISWRDGFFEIITNGGRLRTAEAVITTTPAHVTARIPQQSLPEASKLLVQIRYASAASVTLVYPANSVPVPSDASGILVPSSEETTISGCTYFSAKWPHFAPADGRQVIRCFIGRSGRPRILDEDDDVIARAAHRDLEKMTGVGESFLEYKVTRLESSMPQYMLGHEQLVSSVFALLEDQPGLALAGAAYRGSGLPDVAASARRAAARVLAHVQAIG